MKKYICILLILMVLTISGIAQQDNDVKVTSKTIGINKTYNKEIVVINITTKDVGNLSYAEGYYSKNNSGEPHLDGRSKIVTKNGTNNMTVTVFRPMSPYGQKYELIMAVVAKDDKIIFKGFYNFNKTVINNKTVSSNMTNSSNDDTKGAPGFGVVIFVITILSAILLIKRSDK